MRSPEEPTTQPGIPVTAEHADKTDPNIRIPHSRRLPVPWGLLVALGLYALSVLGYVWATWWRSPDYIAAEHYTAAREILGPKQGRGVGREGLLSAYTHLLEAARLKPEVKSFHEQLESLNWRFDERGWAVPQELRNRAEAVALTWMNIQKANAPILVIGVRDRGWAPDQLLEGPRRIAMWSPVGGLLIIALWASLKFNARTARAQQKEADLQQVESELAEFDLQRHRVSRGSGASKTRKRSQPKR